MNTPICDFVRRYADSDNIRMHMPGHKGTPLLGCEAYDITEIESADELFAPTGIIAESEANASKIFGCMTIYSTEGSSLCIRAMLYLAMQYAAETGRRPVIAAARNVHKTFVTAAVLLGFDILWINCNENENYLKSSITEIDIKKTHENANDKPVAVYVTSPDYLGNVTDFKQISSYCHAHHMLLIVDNAHGAYLHFLAESKHPITQGADIVCDSAHKTLPVLTGGAYLHISDNAPKICKTQAKTAMELFATTSPSYLILQSLDLCNDILMNDFSRMLQSAENVVNSCKAALSDSGFVLCGTEPMKVTIAAKKYGYTGTDLADMLRRRGVVCEFADIDFLVLMVSPYLKTQDILHATDALCSVPQKDQINEDAPKIIAPEIVCTPREAMLGRKVSLPISECVGRVCAEISFSCPPAVPIIVCGERITAQAAECLRYYGVQKCAVMA